MNNLAKQQLKNTDVNELSFLMHLFMEYKDDEPFFVQGRLVAAHQMAMLKGKPNYANKLWKDEAKLRGLLRHLEKNGLIKQFFSANFVRINHKITSRGVAFMGKGGFTHGNIF